MELDVQQIAKLSAHKLDFKCVINAIVSMGKKIYLLIHQTQVAKPVGNIAMSVILMVKVNVINEGCNTGYTLNSNKQCISCSIIP